MTDQALDRFARQVLLDTARQEYGALLEERPEHTFSSAFEKKMKKLLRRGKHPARYQLIQAAACILLALLLTGCAVLAISPEAREVFASWVREIYEDQYIYRIHPEDDKNIPLDELSLPESVYRPVWMPESYQIEHEFITDQIMSIVYKNDSNALAVFGRFDGGVLQVGRDGSETYTQVFVNGKPADLYLDQDEGEHNILIWEDGEMVYRLSAPFNETEMKKAAESVEAQALSILYQPNWLPDGYRGWTVEVSKDGTWELQYIGDHARSITWNYAPLSTGEELFADRKTDARPVLVNGSPAELYLGVDEKGTNELVWKDEEKELLFWIHGSVTEDELIKMAESMDE